MPTAQTANRINAREAEPTPARSNRWPQFLVSAPQRAPLNWGDDASAKPFGTWHARRSGSLQSACGLPAVNWYFFWTLRFSDAGARACVDCGKAVRVAATSPNQS